MKRHVLQMQCGRYVVVTSAKVPTLDYSPPHTCGYTLNELCWTVAVHGCNEVTM